MKSEERHRLHETELHKLGRHAREFWEPFSRQYLKIALIGVGVVCLMVGVFSWWKLSSSAAQAERWSKMLAANSSEDYAAIADEYENEPVSQWAKLKEAEFSLLEGIRDSFLDRQASLADLAKAREAFETLMKQESLPDLVRERALFGLARCLETLAGVDLGEVGENVAGTEEAVKAYERFVESFPESLYRPVAEKRIEELRTDRAKDFYAWYREQNPNPEDRERPQDGLPAGHPPFSGDPGSPLDGPTFPPGQPAMPPLTEDSAFEELESFIKGTQNPSPDETTPETTPDSTPAKPPAAEKSEAEKTEAKPPAGTTSPQPPAAENKPENKPEDKKAETGSTTPDGPSLTPPKPPK